MGFLILIVSSLMLNHCTCVLIPGPADADDQNSISNNADTSTTDL